jgi:hypothetical protein
MNGGKSGLNLMGSKENRSEVHVKIFVKYLWRDNFKN